MKMLNMIGASVMFFETAFAPVMARAIRINIIDATEGPTFSEVRFQSPAP